MSPPKPSLAPSLALARPVDARVAAAAESPAGLPPSVPLAAYRVLGPFTTGGMARLDWVQASSGRDEIFVLKRLLPELVGRADLRALFQREVALTARLAHPNLVRLVAHGHDGPAAFLVLRWVRGVHLGALFAHSLRQRRPLPLVHCVDLMRQALRGLTAAHGLQDATTGQARGVWHGDICPQNILVSVQGSAVVIDFGLAGSVDRSGPVSGLRGRPAYLAPERCEGAAADARSDLYAWAVVLYELLARRRLFPGAAGQDVMRRVVTGHIAPPSAHNPAVDPVLDQIVMWALARDPAQRPPHGGALEDELRAWQGRNGPATGENDTVAAWLRAHAPSLPALPPGVRASLPARGER